MVMDQFLRIRTSPKKSTILPPTLLVTEKKDENIFIKVLQDKALLFIAISLQGKNIFSYLHTIYVTKQNKPTNKQECKRNIAMP